MAPLIFIPDAHGTKNWRWKLALISGSRNWSWFMAPVSGAYVMGLRFVWFLFTIVVKTHRTGSKYWIRYMLISLDSTAMQHAGNWSCCLCHRIMECHKQLKVWFRRSNNLFMFVNARDFRKLFTVNHKHVYVFVFDQQVIFHLPRM